ncbi:MAG TPA: hypothetical protein IAC75_07320 [Candidatus Spyradosoma merdigallinarum]|uniref:Uncharacterized protein n=1 Tax=Candidatus Spyradosoma merdigallinarum TaxID=2840950 RepID=A0A9D1NKT7_9BACT|nr:hypothetical protein [Candidatus Spyradosoma merdigallinarum]
MRSKKLLRLAVAAALALAGAAALASCGGPQVFHYGNTPANITVDQA